MQRRRRTGTTLSGLLGVLTLLAGACGDDDVTAGADDQGMAAVDSDEMTDAMADAGHDHDHDEGELTEWPSGVAVPAVEVDVTAHEGGDVHIVLTIDGFTILPSGAEATTETEGHLHVAVDGAEAQMFFGTDIELMGVPAGPHQAVVTLSAADHSALAVDGEPLAFTADFTVPGEVETPDVTVEIAVDADGGVAEVIDVEAARGDLILVTVTSEVMEELHVHAYERMLELHPGHTVELRFVADIPGVFEIELEGSGTLAAELTVR